MKKKSDCCIVFLRVFSLVALNDQGLIEQLLRDEYIIGFMGILECKLFESSVIIIV